MHHAFMHPTRRAHRLYAALIGSLLWLGLVAPALAEGTLDKVRTSGTLTLGYRADTQPFSFADATGKPDGYSVALCRRVFDAVKTELKLPALKAEWVAVTPANRFEALQRGQIDLLCGAASPTLGRRAIVDFSILIFDSGIGAMVRTDAAKRLHDALAGRTNPTMPVWRGAPGALTQKVVFAAVAGSTVEHSLIEALAARRIEATVAPVPDYASGTQMVLDGRAAAFFGDRPVLLDTAKRSSSAGELLVVDRVFRREPLALAVRRGDDAFRLVVDRSLSELFRSKDFAPLYARFFGAPGPSALAFFELVALPD